MLREGLMTKPKLARMFNRIVKSLALAAAVLSIANIDSLMMMDRPTIEVKRLPKETRQAWRAHLKLATPTATEPAPAPEVLRLRDQLSGDELAGENPFSQLKTIEPLTHLLKLGVRSYQRQALRSPEYTDETGYDLLAYDVEHPDRTHSYILAYLEKSEARVARTPVVLVMRAEGEHTRQSYFRAGELLQENEMARAQVETLVDQRLKTGIPFFSVAR